MAKKQTKPNPVLSVVPRKNTPNEKVINALREALRDAKEGKVQCVGIALGIVDESPDADAGRSTETILSASDGWYHTLSTAVNGMAFRLNYERYNQGCSIPMAKLTGDDE